MNTNISDSETGAPSVIVPWDFSDYSKFALKFARKRFADGQIKVLCVLERPNPYVIGFDWGEDAERAAVRDCTDDFQAEAGLKDDSAIEFKCEFGEPADEIIRFTNSEQAEYIVMSTRGRTGLGKFFLGSVAQKVIAHSNCPVIILPSKWSGFNGRKIS